MKIIEVDTEQFNKMTFDRREISTRSDKELMVVTIGDWAKRHGADTVYKYKRPNGILWMIEEK